MPRGNSTNNILAQILADLEGMISSQKAGSADSGKGSVPPSSIGNISVSGANTKAAADSLNGIASSVLTLSKISKKDVDNAVQVIDLISASLGKIKIDKKDISGLGEALDAFAKMHGMISQVSGNFLKMVIKYNPARGWLAGWSLGGFYRSFMKGFEKKLAMKDVLDQVKGLGGENNKNLGANLSGLSDLMKTILTLDWKQLLKVGIAWKMFPSSAGKNIAAFMKPIIDVINDMPGALQNTKFSKNKFKTSAEVTQVSNPKIAGFLEVFHALTSVTLGQIIKLSLMGKVLNENKGKKIGSFFGSFVKEVTETGEKKAHEAANVVKSVSMMFISLSLSLVAITATVAIAGWDKALIALAILGVLVGTSMIIIKKLAKQEMKANAKESLVTVGAVVLLYMSLSLTLMMLTSLVKNNKPEHIIGGMAILAVLVLASMWMVKKLGSTSMEKAAKDSLKAVGSILLLLVGLTLVAYLSIGIGKNAKDIAIGSAIILGLAVVGILLFKWMSKIPETKMKHGLIVVGTITLMMLAMTVVALLAVNVGKYIKEAALGTLVILGLTVAGIFMFKFLSKIKKDEMISGVAATLAIGVFYLIMCFTIQKHLVPAMQAIDKIGNKGIWTGIGLLIGMTAMGVTMFKLLSKVPEDEMINGLIIAGGIALVILTLNKGLQLFGKFLESVHKVTGKDIAIGSAIMVGMITAVGAACFAAGTLVMGPQAALYAAGVVALEGISLVILTLSAALLKFAQMVITIKKNLTQQSIDDATNMIVGKGPSKGMVGCITDIVSGLSEISIWSAIKIGIISKNLNPLFLGLSKFVDVIQKMAAMKMLDHYDEKGKPVYVLLKPESFTLAATNLSTSFATFLKELNNAFVNGPSVDKMKKIIKSLTKGGIVDLMSALSLFTDSIVKMAGLQVPDKWDNNGKPIHYMKLTKTDFKNAAINLASAFSTFLKEMTTQTSAMAPVIGRVMRNLAGTKDEPGLKALMEAVCTSVDPFIKIASGKIMIDKKEYNTDLETLTKGATALVQPMSYILKNMSDLYRKISKRNIKKTSECINIVNKTMAGAKNFYKNANELVKGSDVIFQWLNKTVISKQKMKLYTDSMNNLGKSLRRNKNTFTTAPLYINKVAKAIRNLDHAIIDRNRERVKAINAMTDSFKHLNDNIGQLNKEMQTSMQLTNQFQQMQAANDRNFIINAVSYVGDVTKEVGKTVEKVHNENKAGTVKKTAAGAQAQQQVNNTDSNMLIAAFVEALNKWNAEHKDLTLELTGQGAIALGTIYGNK